MKSFISLIVFVALLALSSCGSTDTETTLRQAEENLQTGNIEMAVSYCDQLSDSTVNTLTPTQMCRVAIIYAKASELSDELDYMASATKCYERALTLDNSRDSLDLYIQSLDIDNQNVLRVIREVSQSLNTEFDYSENESDEEDIDIAEAIDQI